MIATQLRYLIFSFIAALLCVPGGMLSAQESQSLSVTPPLFQISVSPGDLWQSNIKVVNNNPYPLTVYAEVANFQATGEVGQGKFVPILAGDTDESTLAEWIEIADVPYVIPPEQSADISFFVDVPTDAAPGGHYAAILISTQEPKSDSKMSVLTSQAVTSLFFMRIEGDVEELGTIREFRATDWLLDVPNAEFSLRFENKGNVHLQPRGDIVITNMWGTERGKIPVNYQTHYGNVLPQSIRDFTFTWKSDFQITDIGRYKAVATLAYGQDGIKSATATTYFWIIPLKGTLITLAVLISFIALIVLMVKAYVRRILALAGVDVTQQKRADRERKEAVQLEAQAAKEVHLKSYRTVSAPLRSGVLDLRQRLSTVEESIDVLATVGRFVVQYKWFFISLCALIGIFISTVLYISSATEEGQDYEVTIIENGTETVLEPPQTETP